MKLHIRDDDGRLTIVPVVRDSITIGRSEGNTIRLPERNVSRQHARLLQNEGILYLEEVRSRFGTRVNGDPLGGRTAVNPGDVIEIGDYRLAIHEDTNEIAVKTTSEMPVIERDDTPIAIPRSEITGDPNAVTAMINLADLPASVDMEEERAIPADQQARLVLLTPQLSGIEHKLVRSPTVIGRTSDSNFQIDHRSISRDHAMITWSKESGYTLHDLGSANGLKVNGEFYKRIDLHWGDELELGHVKAQFVAPNEQVVGGARTATDDIDSYPIAAEAPSRLAKVAVIFTSLVAIGVVGFWVLNSEPTRPDLSDSEDATSVSSLANSEEQRPSDRDESKTDEEDPSDDLRPAAVTTSSSTKDENAMEDPKPPAVDPEEKPDTTASASVKPIEEVEPADPTPPKATEAVSDANKAEAKRLGRLAKSQQKAGNAANAARLAQRALALDKNQPTAKAVLREVRANLNAEKSLTKAKLAAQKSNWKAVWKHSRAGLRKSTDGALKADLRSLKDRAQKNLVSSTLKRANGYATKGQWKLAKRSYLEVRKYDKSNSIALKGVKRATKELAAPKATPTPDTGLSKLDQAKALYQQAKAAKRSGNTAVAEKLYKECLKTHSGMASCRSELVPLLMAGNKVCSAVRHMRRYVRARPGGKKTPNFKKLIERFEAQCN